MHSCSYPDPIPFRFSQAARLQALISSPSLGESQIAPPHTKLRGVSADVYALNSLRRTRQLGADSSLRHRGGERRPIRADLVHPLRRFGCDIRTRLSDLRR